MAEKLTATDRENIQAYLSAMKALEAKEPEYNLRTRPAPRRGPLGTPNV